MNVFVHNFNPASNSGPNKFSRQLFSVLVNDYDVKIIDNQNEADIEFALIQLQSLNTKPLVMRLDGIYFNSEQDYEKQNSPIKLTYDRSHSVIYQSAFNRSLTEKWFGKHKNGHIIHNAPDLDLLSQVEPINFENNDINNAEIWCCASSWRPHKRLEENLRYFSEKAPSDSLMIVAGKNPDIKVIKKYNEKSSGRVLYAGDLNYSLLLSLYKKASTFVHLAYLDHCPNVVIDAQASGCHVVCSASGGTSEIISDGTVIPDKEWDYRPTRLYDPPLLDFSNYYVIKKDAFTDINLAAQKYYKVFEQAANHVS
jgi:glycosyltransferase involved in cell wall biosynthesis